MTFRTELCDVLGIEYPILQSGMGGVAGPELAAEVSRAGGLGIVAGLNVPPDDLRRMIRRVRELTDRPFGVNLWLHLCLRTPLDPATIPEETVGTVQGFLNGFRQRLGIPTTVAPPRAVPNVLEAGFRVLLEERVPVWSIIHADFDAAMVRECHARGTKVISMVSTVADARTVAAAGVDAIVAQGGEAGGHRALGANAAAGEPASVATIALVPQIVDAVRVPVVAAGGLADGRGLVAALALGASGILLGTRFVATRESAAPDFYKKSLLERESETTTLTNTFTGLHARMLANTFTREYAVAGVPVLPPLVHRSATLDISTAATQQNDGEYVPMFAGHSVGLIHDLPGAGDIVHAIIREARAVLNGLPARVKS
jgi:nitronate monooxygenase